VSFNNAFFTKNPLLQSFQKKAQKMALFSLLSFGFIMKLFKIK